MGIGLTLWKAEYSLKPSYPIAPLPPRLFVSCTRKKISPILHDLQGPKRLCRVPGRSDGPKMAVWLNLTTYAESKIGSVSAEQVGPKLDRKATTETI